MSARFVRARLVLAALVSGILVSSCVDAPSAPDAGSFAAPLVFAPSLALVGPTGEPAATEAQNDALNQAFDLVDRFRMVVTRVATGETVVDTVIAVTPGQDEYDLSVSVDVASAGERFLIVLTALRGTTELFTAEPVSVQAMTAAEASSSSPPAATNVTMRYSGPGASATSVQLSPAALVLGPEGSGSFAAEVQGDDGSVLGDVPLFWSVVSGGVVQVSEGMVTAAGEGAVQVVVSTPTGLEARAWTYVVGGELAYAEGGVVKVRGAAAGEAVDRSSAGGAGQPAWSPDGNRLFYSAAGRVHLAGGDALMDGSWPSVSPDGSKLAVEAGASIFFANDDGTNLTAGPSGGTPVWADGANLLVSGGSVQQVRADGSGRTTVAGGSASLPARAPSGEVAYVAEGRLFVVGRAEATLDGAAGRPSWSANGMWLVVATGSGLTVVPADGSAPGAPLPGLAEASDPAFKPGNALAPPASVVISGLDPDPPLPGGAVTIVGSGFDWIIPGNNRVFWPTPEGVVEGEVRSVTATTIETVMPSSMAEGQIRVETRASIGLMAFDPQFAAIDVIARTPFGDPVSGIGVVVRDGEGAEVLRGGTDDEGRALMAGLLPGDYQVEVLAPTGFRLESEATYRYTLSTETVLLEVVVMPLVRSVTTVPEELEVEVGQTVEVTLVPVDYRGEVMAQVSSATWVGGLPTLVARGEGLSGFIVGATPGAGPTESVLVVQLNGEVFEIPATVTSYVEGTVVRDPDPAPVGAESASGSETASAATDTEPSPGTEVKVVRDGRVVSTGVADGQGRYHARGLFAGAFTVTIDPTEDRSPVPDTQAVVLSDDSPTATADFLMSRAPVDSVVVAMAVDTIRALMDTASVVVTPLDSLGNPLGGRRAVIVSSDTLVARVAVVGGNGIVTAAGNGSAVITVTVEGKTASVGVAVDQWAVKLTITKSAADPAPSPDSAIIIVGDTGTVAWDARDSNDFPVMHKTPVFVSTNPPALTVDAAGSVTAVSMGFTALVASLDDGVDTVEVDVRALLTTDLIIKTTADLAAAQAARYGRIMGGVFVDSTALVNIDGLETIIEVLGNVYIRMNGSLGDISGLADMVSAGGLFIEYNPVLTTPLSAPAMDLTVVHGTLRVLGNAGITNADLFAKLSAVDGDLDISQSLGLTDIDGLSGLSWIGGSLNLEGNPNLAGPTVLPGLAEIGGGLKVLGGGVILRFPALATIAGDVMIGTWGAGDLILKEMGFPALTCLGGSVNVTGNAALETLTLPVLPEVGPGCVVTPSPPPKLVSDNVPMGVSASGRFSAGVRAGRTPVDTLRLIRAERAQATRDQLEAWRQSVKETPEVEYEQKEREAEARRALRRNRGLVSPSLREPQANSRGGAAAALQAALQAAHDSARAVRGGPVDRPREDRSKRTATNDEQRAALTWGSDFYVQDNPLLSTLDVGSLRAINGRFTLHDSSLPDLLLPALQEARDIDLRATPIRTMSAPLLVYLTWDLDVHDNANMVTMDLPLLDWIGDDLHIHDNDALTTLFFPALDWVDDEIDIDYNDAMTSVRIPIITGQDSDSDDLDIHDNDALLTISIAETTEFESGDDVHIARNGMLRSISMPGVVRVYDDLQIHSNASLESITIGTIAPLHTRGSVYVWENASLKTVDLPRLNRIGFYLSVDDNVVLERFSAPVVTVTGGNMHFVGNGSAAAPLVVDLPALETVGSVGWRSDLRIESNPGIRTVSFPALTHVTEDVWILDNPDLTKLDLPLLGSTGGWFEVGGNASLTSFTLPSLTSVPGWLHVADHPLLTTFSVPALTTIGGHLDISHNRVLQDFGLGAVTSIGAFPSASTWAVILGNRALTGFDLSSLSTVYKVSILDNDAMTTLPALPSLDAGASVEIEGNDLLGDLNGLAGLTGLGTVYMGTNPALTDVSGLSSLQTVSALTVLNNDALVTFDGMGSLTTITVNVRVAGNDVLTTLSFPSLSRIGGGAGPSASVGDLQIQANLALTSLSFPALVEIDSRVSLIDNTALADLNGLGAVTSPMWMVEVQGNTALRDVTGLNLLGGPGALPAAHSFSITGNTGLTDAAAWALVTTIEANNPGPNDDLPSVVISGNDP